jgi:hypothetical protein
MSGPISFEFAGTMFLVVSAVVAAWLQIQRKIKDSSDASWKAIDELRTSHSSLREQVIRDYASVQRLEKLESKLVAAVERLAEEVKTFSRAVIELKASERRPGPRARLD